MADALAAAKQLLDLDPALVRCPYPVFAALRERSPVVWIEQLEAFVVSSYELIAEVLRQPEKFSSRRATGPQTDRTVGRRIRELSQEDPEFAALIRPLMELGSSPVLVRADPPVHSRQRALVSRAFRPSVVRALEADIRSLANNLIDQFADHGRVELISEYALPIPMTVIATALGVSLDRMDDFQRWSDGLVGGVGKGDLDDDDVRAIVISRAELAAYIFEIAAEREQAPRADLVSQIVHATIDGDRLSRYEIFEMVTQFLVAGNETTAKLIAATALMLACDPQLAASVRDDPDRLPALIEETLRLEPPSTGLFRIAETDCELGNVTIPAGSSIWLVYAAGNRDPERFETPDACLLDRPATTPHLAFGLGPHFCVGAGLARTEARIALECLVARCPDLALDIPADDVPYVDSYMIHGIRSLPLTFRPTTP
jgi:cytochrome P450